MAISLVSLVLLLAAGCGGCRQSAPPPAAAAPAGPATGGQHGEELLSLAIDNLNHLEEFSSADLIQQITDRLDPRNQKAGQRFDPLLESWPAPEMLGQIVDRLNQWAHGEPPPEGWKPDPMAAGVPKPLADLPQLKDLDGREYSAFDGYFLQETTWLRDISRWARGGVLDELERAKSIFDWTIRNIQIDADFPGRTPQFPWETLLFGHGTAAERAWVFVLLLRQLDIDAAMLAIDEAPAKRGLGTSVPSDAAKLGLGTSVPSKNGGQTSRPWCVGVLVEGEVYLFDPLLGLPIPAPKGVTHGARGELAIQPATLAQVVAEPELLRRLDIDPSHKYPVEAADLKHVVPQLEASPDYLSERMRLLETHLRGDIRMVLTTAPSEHAERWKAAKHLAPARLWPLPLETLDRRRHLDRNKVMVRLAEMLPFGWVYEDRVTLRNRDLEGQPGEPPGASREEERTLRSAALGQGRTLHLKGKLTGDDGAIHFYQMARPTDERLRASSMPLQDKAICLRGKLDATYWLGLIAQERGKYETAADDFLNRGWPKLTSAESPWTAGARYNLARTYEAAGDIPQAVGAYRSNDSSPGYQGDLLRARWLVEQNR